MAAWYEKTETKSIVREYKSREEMDRDVAEAGAVGWSVVSVSELSQRSGCIRIILLNLLALVWRPKSHFLVTFSHP